MAIKRSTKALVIAGVLGLVGFVIYGSMARVERVCELCIEFEGRTECRRGAGATDEEAKDAAITAACGVMASGMDQAIRCRNTPPKTVSCTGR
jgi:hypothetical protein